MRKEAENEEIVGQNSFCKMRILWLSWLFEGHEWLPDRLAVPAHLFLFIPRLPLFSQKKKIHASLDASSLLHEWI
jgi:hypothetical protein